MSEYFENQLLQRLDRIAIALEKLLPPLEVEVNLKSEAINFFESQKIDSQTE